MQIAARRNESMKLPLVLACLLSSCVLASSVRGEPHDRHERGWHGDIRVFHERDIHLWRGGHWYHGWYGGRFGWFWMAGGAYYLYPAPIYPYPDPYTPPVVVQQAPVVVQQQAPVYVEKPQASVPATPAPNQPAQPANTWYYCDAAKSYYPYVSECPGGWRAVPATPAR